MPVLEDLREQRSGLMAELETLNKETKLSDEQRARWDAAEAEVDDLDKEIERRKRQAEREARAAADRAARTGGAGGDVTDGTGPTGSGWTVGIEPTTYGKGSRQSYFLDLARSELNRGDGSGGPTAARERLKRHAQEIDVDLPKRQQEIDRAAERKYTEALMAGSKRERRAAMRMLSQGVSPFEKRFISRVDGAGGYFVPPLWLIDEYIPYLRAGREHADLARQLPLPAGTDNINIPRVTIGTATGPQVADGGVVPGRDMTDSFVSAPVRTIAGQQDAALQLLDQSPITFDEIIFQDLTEDYNMQLDGQTLVGSGVAGQIVGVYPAGAIASANQIVVQNTNTNTVANGQTWVAVGTGGGAGTLFLSSAQLLSQMSRNRMMPPDRWVWNPTLWYMLLSTLDSQNRPLVVPGGNGGAAFNQAANDEDGPLTEGAAGTYYGLPVILDVNMPLTFGGTTAPQITTISNGTYAPTPGSGTNANYTPILAERTSDLFLWEGEMRTRVLSEVLSGNLQIRFQVYNYVAYLTNRYQSYATPGQVVSVGSVFTGGSSNFNPLLNPVNLGF
jgi:HK97 family phage major capsid protein